jgi:excisionase family DNA binding protein
VNGNISQRENTPAQTKLMLNKREAAEMLSLSVRTIENLIANGELKFRRIGKRVLIPLQILAQFTRGDHSTSQMRLAER